MSQASGDKSGQTATARAEELLDSMGRRLGLFAARAGQRIQNTATYVREQAERMDLPKITTGENSSQSGHPGVAGAEEKLKPAMDRSEELVEQLVQRLTYFASVAGFQAQKALARAREEAEDMWAEAQHIRQENDRKPQ